MLKATNLSLTIDDTLILSNINLDVSAGEMLCILGPNGAGKSSLLNCLTGDDLRYSGTVTINGNNISTLNSEQLAVLRAVMPQSIHLDFPFLVKEVVQMALRNVGREELEMATLLALSRFDVSHLAERNFLTLSGGEKQRVHLARVLAQLEYTKNHQQQTRYLFLDECTSSLDLAHQHQVFRMVKDFAQEQQIAVVAILHDLNLAAQYSDRALLLKTGKVQALDTVQKVYSNQLISHVYDFPVEIIQHPKGWPMVISA
jgi:iron complex transport system ATP-binding protein